MPGLSHDEIADAYGRYGHLVFARCRRILRNEAEADDAAQEVFVRLWRYGAELRVAESKVAWLYRVADRCCFDTIARRIAVSRSSELDGRAEAAPDASEGSAAFENHDLVLRLLAHFDDDQRELAVLRYVDEMSHEEIAAFTGWSRPTVAKKLEQIEARGRALGARLRAQPVEVAR